VLQVWILIPLEHTDTMVDGLNTGLWASDSKLDHSRGLVFVSENSMEFGVGGLPDQETT
jgi:hypothetical protein